ncbi:hypothetical protein CY34DRAFT_133530 [Suillus luteus UH-Slu-Lm8-n1]|uniref:Uncharacterized protein n=1 Tax=Suillus luteus UH-Slu-Lm8-n1 TaxID=930992 RepID=A0A0C9Z5I4_9AGAM|nr:hypothetical protein CY34DRAFT_133530 [Suillus luteus UH-Slu-Lm8-n1]
MWTTGLSVMSWKRLRVMSLRSEIIQNGKILAEMLSNHFPAEILRLIVTFKSLSSHREIRQKIQEMREYQNLKQDTLYYLDPHHHPHEHDQYTSASTAIESFIVSYDRPTSKVNPLFFLFLFLMFHGALYPPLL